MNVASDNWNPHPVSLLARGAGWEEPVWWDRPVLWCRKSTLEFCRALGSFVGTVGSWAGRWVMCAGLRWAARQPRLPVGMCAGSRWVWLWFWVPGSESRSQLDTHCARSSHSRVHLPVGTSDTGDLVVLPSPKPTPALSAPSAQQPCRQMRWAQLVVT